MQVRLIEQLIRDAETSELKLLRLKPDENGCVLELEGCSDSLVIDLRAATLRVFIADENGEVSHTTTAIFLTGQVGDREKTLWRRELLYPFREAKVRHPRSTDGIDIHFNAEDGGDDRDSNESVMITYQKGGVKIS